MYPGPNRVFQTLTDSIVKEIEVKEKNEYIKESRTYALWINRINYFPQLNRFKVENANSLTARGFVCTCSYV